MKELEDENLTLKEEKEELLKLTHKTNIMNLGNNVHDTNKENIINSNNTNKNTILSPGYRVFADLNSSSDEKKKSNYNNQLNYSDPDRFTSIFHSDLCS